MLACLLATSAFAQLPLLDTLSRDPTDDAAYARLPFDSLTDLPVSCDAGYFVAGFVDTLGVISLDCLPALTVTGTPNDGDCPIWNSGTGRAEWGPCGTGGGDALVVFGPDYCFFNSGGADRLIYYTGS